MGKEYYVYIMGSVSMTLYIGVTSNLIRRVYEHKEGLINSFSKEYNVKRLLYYEVHTDVRYAITREKQIKKWKRQWKINLIVKDNPEIRDLYYDLIGFGRFPPPRE